MNTILLLFLFVFSSTLYSSESDIFGSDKSRYFAAKQLYFKKKYIKSNFLFNRIIKNNKTHSKYATKSRVYKLLIRYNLNKKIGKRHISVKYFKKDSRYSDIIHYIYAVSKANGRMSGVKKLIFEKRATYDTRRIKSALKALKKIKKRENIIIIKEDVVKLIRALKKIEINKIKYDLDHKRYISALYKTRFYKKSKIRYPEDYEKLFFRLKTLNEMYLSSVASIYILKIDKVLLSNKEI